MCLSRIKNSGSRENPAGFSSYFLTGGSSDVLVGNSQGGEDVVAVGDRSNFELGVAQLSD